jgi:hypothetical protein
LRCYLPRVFPMVFGQLNRVPERVRSLSAPIPATVFNPPSAKLSESADDGGGNPSILMAAGIILGCALIGTLLLLLAAGSKRSDATPGHRTSVQQTSNPTANANESLSQRGSAGPEQARSGKGRAAKGRSLRSRRPEGSRIGGAYVVAEPGKTPRMFESQ